MHIKCIDIILQYYSTVVVLHVTAAVASALPSSLPLRHHCLRVAITVASASPSPSPPLVGGNDASVDVVGAVSRWRQCRLRRAVSRSWRRGGVEVVVGSVGLRAVSRWRDQGRVEMVPVQVEVRGAGGSRWQEAVSRSRRCGGVKVEVEVVVGSAGSRGVAAVSRVRVEGQRVHMCVR
ncbi:hypothetical protein EDB85DRAFT_1894747 [Lactarius pseudohatsudake]|nr:hypothetical protein EDB85DRAFT_1894747 [Lactarius pseudohatsudake]